MKNVIIKEYKDKGGDPAYMPPNGKLYGFREYSLDSIDIKDLLNGFFLAYDNERIRYFFPNGLKAHFVKDHIVEVGDE